MLCCKSCGQPIPVSGRFCTFCGRGVASTDFLKTQPASSDQGNTPGDQRALANSSKNRSVSLAGRVGGWTGRHPKRTILLIAVVLGCLGTLSLHRQSPASGSQRLSSASQGSAHNALGLATVASQSGAQTIRLAATPKFRIFKFKTDVPTSYVVPLNTSDDELKSLLWLFRESVRTGNFTEIGITQPTTKQWGHTGYTSGTLDVFRGEKCANEEYISNTDIDEGKLGPCGYGEHDDAYYQWGIDADPNKDGAGIVDKNGNTIPVFDYKDDWHPSSEALRAPDQSTKEEWRAKQEEWAPMQRLAVQIANVLAQKGLNVDASANEIQPTELDLRSQLFTNSDFRDAFLSNALPQVNRDLCNVGFQSVRISGESDPNAEQSYSLHCQ
jgi:hypothetical protein